MAAAYYVERDKGRLWIVPPKCGITSMLATGLVTPADREMAEKFAAGPGVKVIATMRHPYDRIVSAIYNHLWDPGRTFAERYELHKDDQHVAPQAPLLDGFDVDVFVPFELQGVYWPLMGIRHRRVMNAGKRRPRSWRDVGFPWEALAGRYACDFEWNPCWEDR